MSDSPLLEDIPARERSNILLHKRAKGMLNSAQSEMAYPPGNAATGSAGIRAFSQFSYLSFLSTGLGALIGGALLARWTWIFFAPPVLVAPPPPAEINSATSAGLFGITTASGSFTYGGGIDTSAPQLIGVFTGQQAFAILRFGTTQRGVALGEEISAGVTLAEVAADHIMLGYAGTLRRIDLEKISSGGPAPDSAKPALIGEGVLQDPERIRTERQKGRGLPDAPS